MIHCKREQEKKVLTWEAPHLISKWNNSGSLALDIEFWKEN
jgi:hypothetical protein